MTANKNEFKRAELNYNGSKTVIARRTKEELDREVAKYVSLGYTVTVTD
jgi:hypothetical protein